MDFFNNTNLADVAVWVFGLLSIFALWGGVVEQFVDKVKPVYKQLTGFVFGLLARLNVSQDIINILNDLAIILAIYAAGYLTANAGYNVFDSYPGKVTLNADLQLIISAGFLALGAFFMHGARKWFLGENEPV